MSEDKKRVVKFPVDRSAKVIADRAMLDGSIDARVRAVAELSEDDPEQRELHFLAKEMLSTIERGAQEDDVARTAAVIVNSPTSRSLDEAVERARRLEAKSEMPDFARKVREEVERIRDAARE